MLNLKKFLKQKLKLLRKLIILFTIGIEENFKIPKNKRIEKKYPAPTKMSPPK